MDVNGHSHCTRSGILHYYVIISVQSINILVLQVQIIYTKHNLRSSQVHGKESSIGLMLKLTRPLKRLICAEKNVNHKFTASLRWNFVSLGNLALHSRKEKSVLVIEYLVSSMRSLCLCAAIDARTQLCRLGESVIARLIYTWNHWVSDKLKVRYFGSDQLQLMCPFQNFHCFLFQLIHGCPFFTIGKMKILGHFEFI